MKSTNCLKKISLIGTGKAAVLVRFFISKECNMTIPKAYKRGRQWFLKLPGDEKPRVIGTRNGKNLVTFKGVNHLYRELNSYGFNKTMIMNEDFEILVVQLPGGVEYRVTRAFFLEHCILKSAVEGSLDEQLHLQLWYFDPEKESAYQRRAEESKRMRKMSPNIYDILAQMKEERQ
jgi:hypothetical protein